MVISTDPGSHYTFSFGTVVADGNMSPRRRSDNSFVANTSTTMSSTILPPPIADTPTIIDYDPDWDSDYEDLTGAMGGAKI